MYLHLGQSTIVPLGDVLGIFDLDNTSASVHTRRFLQKADKEGRVIDVSGDLPKSFTLCQSKEGSPLIYLSQLSSATLLKRVEGKLLDSI